MIDGVLLINKEAGPSSHDIVNEVRKFLPRKTKVGHAGTLDPFATGLLVLVIGKATSASRFLMYQNKVYQAAISFGAATDTLDSTGKIIEVVQAQFPAKDQIEEVLKTMIGPALQEPPMYSAKKVDGKPLYKLARKGLQITREKKMVEVLGAKLSSINPPEFVVEFNVSKGTYVRVLALDICRHLGGTGHLAALKRISSGTFHIDRAHAIDEVKSSGREGKIENLIIPFDKILDGYPRIILNERSAGNLLYGQAPSQEGVVRSDPYQPGDLVCLINQSGKILAMGRTLANNDSPNSPASKPIVKLERVFASNSSS